MTERVAIQLQGFADRLAMYMLLSYSKAHESTCTVRQTLNACRETRPFGVATRLYSYTFYKIIMSVAIPYGKTYGAILHGRMVSQL